MPYKDKQKQKEAQRKHYLNNKDKYRESTKKRRKTSKIVAHEIKAKMGCSCGETDSRCLDFHHSDPSVKEFTVAQAIRESGKAKLLTEIEKCEVVCANCHLALHSTEWQDGSKWKGFNPARIAKRRWFYDYLCQQKCNRCPESRPCCLDHHHLRNKRYEIGYLLTSGHSLEYLKEEISQCEVLCRNCHRKEHC